MKNTITVLILPISNSVLASISCRDFYSIDQKITKYINASTFQKAISQSIQDLSKFKLQLEQAKAEGTHSLNLTALKEDYTKKEAELIQYLEENGIMTQEQLRIKMKELIISLQEERIQKDEKEEQKKDEQRKATREALDPINLAKNKMIFHEIKPGIFSMGEEGARVETEITKPFEMMATPVTQMMWVRIKMLLGETEIDKINPSFFKDKDTRASITVNIEDLEIKMQPDHPVEQVDRNDVSEFVENLNGLSKSNDKNIQQVLEKLIPGHQKGDIYDLPSEAQWEFVMKNRGKANSKYFDKSEPSELVKYAWFIDNTKTTEFLDGKTNEVATKKPRIIDGMPFYDLEGNVWEITKDMVGNSLSKNIGGKDPLETSGSFPAVRGGGYYNEVKGLRMGFRQLQTVNYKNAGVGFRLVRIRP